MRSPSIVMGLRQTVALYLKGPTFRADPLRDSFLASYPRSGNTWLRAALFHVRIGRPPQSLAELDLGIPDEHYTIPRRAILRASNARELDLIVKTHVPYQLQLSYRRVAYVVRDPRDVIPSYFRLWQNRSKSTSFDDFVQASFSGAVWPCSWYDHVKSWQLYQKISPGCISIIRYEDLTRQVEPELEKLGSALNVKNVPELKKQLHQYNLSSMRKLEQLTGDSGRYQGAFVGQGRAKDVDRKHVDAAIRNHVPHWLALMNELGYSI